MDVYKKKLVKVYVTALLFFLYIFFFVILRLIMKHFLLLNIYGSSPPLKYIINPFVKTHLFFKSLKQQKKKTIKINQKKKNKFI